MTIAAMTAAGLSMAYRTLGDDATFTRPGQPAEAVRVIYSVDGTAVLDGMVQSIGPSLRIRASDAPEGVPRHSVFELLSTTWRAKEKALPINDGLEYLVHLGLPA
jgi:hypothetical protein